MFNESKIEELYQEVNHNESLRSLRKRVICYHMKKFISSCFVVILSISLVALLGLGGIFIKTNELLNLLYIVLAFAIFYYLLLKTVDWRRKIVREAEKTQDQYIELYGKCVINPILKERGSSLTFRNNESEKIVEINADDTYNCIMLPFFCLFFSKQSIEENNYDENGISIHDIIINQGNMNEYDATCLVALTNIDSDITHMILSRTYLNYRYCFIKCAVLVDELSHEFQKRFYVESTDVDALRKLLTPELIEKLLSLKGFELSIYLIKGTFYIFAKDCNCHSNFNRYFNVFKPSLCSTAIVSRKKINEIVRTLECLLEINELLIKE